MRKVFFILIMAILALSFCSKERTAAPGAQGDQAGAPGGAAGQAGASDASGGQAGGAQKQPQDLLNRVEEPLLRIRSVALSPEAPTVLDDVTAKAEVVDAGKENVRFLYQWFVNGKEVAAINGADLDKTHYKKGSWIYCRVQAVSDNGESEWFKSDAIRVLNSLPVLRLPPVENFTVPSEISFQAAASDADNDPLTYELLAPLEQGIAIDPKTGLLTWKIDADAVASLGETIEIKLAVSDGEGAKVTGTVTLKLTSTKQTK